MFFPPFRQRVRRNVAQRAKALVEAVVETAQAALREQVDTVDRLAREGRDLLLLIDLVMIASLRIRATVTESIAFLDSRRNSSWLSRRPRRPS
jgi:hypothetical protein